MVMGADSLLADGHELIVVGQMVIREDSHVSDGHGMDIVEQMAMA